MKREGYHWLPIKAREERNKRIVKLYDSGVPCKAIAETMGLGYWGARRILQKAGRMGNLTRVSSGVV